MDDVITEILSSEFLPLGQRSQQVHCGVFQKEPNYRILPVKNQVFDRRFSPYFSNNIVRDEGEMAPRMSARTSAIASSFLPKRSSEISQRFSDYGVRSPMYQGVKRTPDFGVRSPMYQYGKRLSSPKRVPDLGVRSPMYRPVNRSPDFGVRSPAYEYGKRLSSPRRY